MAPNIVVPDRCGMDTATCAPPSTLCAPPSTRDPAADLLRALALLGVVCGHWLLAVTWWTPNGSLHASNLLEVAPWTQWATWLLQPVPLFFVVGGWASSVSWQRVVDRAAGDARAAADPVDVRMAQRAWLLARQRRLLVPASTFVAFGAVVGLLLNLAMPRAGARATHLLAMPLWFLAVYVPVTLATPWLVAAVRRWRWGVPVGLLGAAVAVDTARFVGGMGLFGWANFALVWLGLAALGTAGAVTPPSRRGTALVAVGAGVVLCAVVAAGWYPVSMVGVGDRSNNTPPTVALALLGVVHAGGAWLLAPRLRRLLHVSPRARKVARSVGALGMHLYLWHLCATVLLVAAQALGVFNVEPLTLGWWLSRPLWLLTLAILATPIAAGAARHDLRRLSDPGALDAPVLRSLPAAATGLLAAVGFTGLALAGFTTGAASLASSAAVVVAAAAHGGKPLRVRRSTSAKAGA